MKLAVANFHGNALRLHAVFSQACTDLFGLAQQNSAYVFGIGQVDPESLLLPDALRLPIARDRPGRRCPR